MDPITMVSAGISALGSLFGGNSAAEAARAQGDIADKQAKVRAQVDSYNAERARQEAGANVQAQLQQGDQAQATAAVQAAANGGGFTGSTLAVLKSLAQSSLYNARAVAYRGVSQGQSDDYAASVDLYNGQLAKAAAEQNASSDFISGLVGGVSDVFGGAAKSNALSRMSSAFSGGGASGSGRGAGSSDFGDVSADMAFG